MAETSVARPQGTHTTREYRVDEDFLALLEEDYGIKLGLSIGNGARDELPRVDILGS